MRKVACALALAAAGPAWAADAAPAGKVIRWADVWSAIDRDPRLASARARAEGAQGALTAAGTPPNPEVEAQLGRGLAREGGAHRDEWGLALTLPLDWLTRRGPAVAAARATVEELRAEAEALRADVGTELWGLYVAADAGTREAEALVATRDQVEALARLVRRRVEAGEGRPVEVPRVELELERVRAEVDAAASARDAALAQLGVWLGGPVSRVEPAPALPVPAAPGAPARHPRVRAAAARAAVAGAEASAARWSRVPALAVAVFTASELDREAHGGRVTVELPLWNWRTGEVRRAEALAAAEASRAEAERRGLEAALAAAEASCGRARSAEERQRTGVLPRAEESARVLERTFQLGETGILDVIDARRVLLEARRAALASARDRDLACGSLILLTSGALP
ncbi:MAG: TolC family protein [Anaeromyxobacteraceae bacterium]